MQRKNATSAVPARVAAPRDQAHPARQMKKAPLRGLEKIANWIRKFYWLVQAAMALAWTFSI
jgi:hypothetical protein